MKSIIQSFVAKLRPYIEKLHAILDRLRTKIPGLPSNRVLISTGGLMMVGVMIFVAMQVLLAPDQPVTTYTLPYTQNFDDVNLKRWFSESGVWTIREGALLQTIGGEGSGQMHIPLKVPEDAPYHASVFITIKKDTREAGISFNAQYPELIAEQHRVFVRRINAETLELVAGYMDETGAFLSQAQVPLGVNTTEFRLDVYVYNNAYLVMVNGQRMIENRPLFYKNGMIGFYTLGPAIFDTYQLTVAENQNPGDMVYTSDFDQEPGGAGWVPISGSWHIDSQQMVQSDPSFNEAAIGYETSTFENYTLRAIFNHLEGQGAGVLFNMASPYQINGAHLVRYSDETDSMIWGYYDAKGIFNRQGYANASPAGTGEHTLQIFSGADSYDILLDDVMIARAVPLQNTQGAIGLTTSRASAGFTFVEVYPLFGASLNPVAALTGETPTAQSTATSVSKATQTAAPTRQPTQVAATPVAVQEYVGGGDSPFHGVFDGTITDAGWKVVNGDWSFADGNFIQTKVDGYDFGVVYTKTAFESFSIQVGFHHVEGSGAGVLFNMPGTDSLAGASMVRYSDKRDNAIVWGYFDETGVYSNQGYADVPNAGIDRHTLRIVAAETTYGIYLDDRLIVQAVPYESGHNAGYFGLVTSRSHVVYDEVAVDGVGAVFKGTYGDMDGFTDQRIVSGKWTIENNIATQSVSDVSDYVWNTGVQASEYTVSAEITLPEADNSGGGFIIHMAERGSKNNSYIVRLKDGGSAIWWGFINDEGKFNGQGSAKFEKAGKTFTLKLVVKLDKVSIYVNDAEIAKDVTIATQEGWIGLLAYGGPVSFGDINLEVEK